MKVNTKKKKTQTSGGLHTYLLFCDLALFKSKHLSVILCWNARERLPHISEQRKILSLTPIVMTSILWLWLGRRIKFCRHRSQRLSRDTVRYGPQICAQLFFSCCLEHQAIEVVGTQNLFIHDVTYIPHLLSLEGRLSKLHARLVEFQTCCQRRLKSTPMAATSLRWQLGRALWRLVALNREPKQELSWYFLLICSC